VAGTEGVAKEGVSHLSAPFLRSLPFVWSAKSSLASRKEFSKDAAKRIRHRPFDESRAYPNSVHKRKSCFRTMPVMKEKINELGA